MVIKVDINASLARFSLNRFDQDTIDRLSDISGPLKPNEVFTPYLTCYPLPSNTFFVLARTWQDINAPRAGCVITKSLLVPMLQWESEANSAKLLTLLIHASSDRNEVFDYDLNFNGDTLFDKEIKAPINELVESIFIEKRQPIVYFNAADTDAIIYRLYSVLWPSLRKAFSVCTFALSQRTIDGKLFDLLFAPISAKPRFNEWPGRRIDGLPSPPRHRWTPALVSSFYNVNQPNLLDDDDNLPYNPHNADFNEVQFRLNIAWKELLYNARTTTPFLPILGLLDVINSLKVDTSNLKQIIHPILQSAIDQSITQLSSSETWTFFASVLLRYKRKSMDRGLFETIKALSRRLAETSPKSAVEFLINYKKPIETLPAILFEGIGDGFASYFNDHTTIQPLDSIKEFSLITTRLTSSSGSFAELLIKKNDFEYSAWDGLLDAVIEAPKNQIKIQAEKNLSLNIKAETRYLTVEKLFNNSDAVGFEVISKNILKNNNYAAATFTGLIYNYSLKFSKQAFLYAFLIKNDKKGNSDQLLALVVLNQSNLLIDLVHHKYLNDQRIALILNYIFEVPDEHIVKILKSNQGFAKDILSSQLKDIISKKALITLLFYGDLHVGLVVNELARLPEKIFDSITPKQFEGVIKALIKQDRVILDQATLKVLKRAPSFDYQTLFQKSTQRNIGAGALLSNLDLLFKIDSRFNKFLSEKVNVISQLLAENLDDKRISNEIAQRWIKFLHASSKNKKLYKEAAVAMLEFGFKCVAFDASQLLLASFPIVYKSFLKGKPITNFLPMFSFPDWDKCRTLREDLVKLYMNRSWSKVGLLYIANSTDTVKETLRILNEKKNGKSFLSEVVTELQKIPNLSSLLNKIMIENR